MARLGDVIESQGIVHFIPFKLFAYRLYTVNIKRLH